MSTDRKISVIGLGYVGLPVAVAFAKAGLSVIAFDIDHGRLDELGKGHDRTNEVARADLADADLTLSDDPAALRAADFHIVTVPTPIDTDRRPDLGPLLAATKTLGSILKFGDIVVYESTVYPGATEEDCVPVLEAESGLTYGQDFFVGYSPERINPGDREHRFETIVKVVAGCDSNTTGIIADTYGRVVRAGIHRAPTIKTAEAAKVIENTQRDLNIALMNELSVIFEKLNIDTGDVLAAAGTKWNFLPFTPGLVGGHCIGVDPYYLTHRAQVVGHEPEVILSGRRINDAMALHIAQRTMLWASGHDMTQPQVTVLGVTFKEDVPDVRNTKVIDMIREFQRLGARVAAHDPMADEGGVQAEFGLHLVAADALPAADVVVLAVAHASFLAQSWTLPARLLKGGRGLVVDIKGRLDRETRPAAIDLWRI